MYFLFLDFNAETQLLCVKQEETLLLSDLSPPANHMFSLSIHQLFRLSQEGKHLKKLSQRNKSYNSSEI